MHEAVFHVLHNPVAILHDGGCDLQGGRTQEDKLRSVLPGLDTADAGDRNTRNAVPQLLDEAQGHRLYRLAGVAGDRRLAVDDGHADLPVQVHIADGLDGVDGGNAVRTALQTGLGHRNHVRDIGSHLGHHGQLGAPFHRSAEALA